MKNLLLLLIILVPFVSNAQFGSANNGNPPNIKWKEISNESARIIFPEGLYSRAVRVADVIDYLNRNNRASIGKPKGKINIILQNQLTEANGFVTAAPLRSEFFTTTPQRSFIGTGDWLDMLAIHEYRHVMQLQFAKQGATKIGSYLFGDLGWISMGFMAIPFWFTEGDAVMQETLLSNGGRGRSGSFLAEYRAMHEAGVKYSYEKIRNRSFKSILPNRYRMGYLFSQYGRNKYGNDFWKYVAKDAVRYEGILWPFAQSLKKRTGKKVHDLYNDMMDSIYHKWDKDNKDIDWKQAEEILINKPISNSRISYYYNPKFKDNNVLVLRSGRDRIPAFYMIDKNGNETKIIDIGYQETYFNYKNDKIVWTEIETDMLWKNRTYSNVYSYDFRTKKKKKITNKTKYFSPDINNDGSEILIVNSDEMMKYRIEILDSKSGKILKAIPNPNNIFFSSPKWLNDNAIIAVAQFNQKNALVKIDINSGKITPIIKYTHNLILRPVLHGNYIYFSGDFTKIRNVFAVDINTKELFQVTNSMVLASHPDVSSNGKYLVYSEQQINGVDIKKIELNKDFWYPISISEPLERFSELNKLLSAEDGDILNKIPHHQYKVKDYSHLKDAINFHSWYPAFQNLNGDVGLGVTLMSTNLLSTLNLSITPSINVNGEKKLSTSLTWKKYYPELNLSYDIARINYKKDEEYSSLLSNYYYTGLKFPLNFSRGAMRRGLTIDLSGGFQNFIVLDGKESSKPDSRLVFINKLHFYNKRVTAYQQLNPRFGQEFDVKFLKSNVNNHFSKNLSYSLDAKIYLPGISRTHSTIISGHYHNEVENKALGFYQNGIRGLNNQIVGINKIFRTDYSFPISYPDIAILNLEFTKRLRANVFFDYGIGVVDNKSKTISSAGIDLIMDIGIFNYGSIFNLPIGIRVSYLNGVKNTFNIQLIVFQTSF